MTKQTIGAVIFPGFEMLDYYLSLPQRFARIIQNEQNREMSHLRNMIIITQRYQQPGLNKEIDDKLKVLIDRLSAETGS